MNSTRQYNDKENKARRWSNCFGLSKKMKRIKNRLSFCQNNDIQKDNINNTTTKDNVLHSTTTLPLKTPTSTIHHVSIYSYYKDEPFEEQEEDEHDKEQEKDKHEKDTTNPHQPIEQINHSKQPHRNTNEEDEDDQDVIKSYFERLSLQDKVQRSSSALSPPPRHNIKPNRGRAFSDTTPLNDNSMYDWRQFTNDYKKMTLRLSIDTAGFKNPPCVTKPSSPPSSTLTPIHTTTNDKNENNYKNDSPIEIAPVRDSMLIYQQDPSSFLLHHPNTSNISQNSSMIPQPPPPPFRTGTLGQPKPTISSSLSTTSTITTSLLTVPAAPAPSPSPSTTLTTSQSPPTSNIAFQLKKKKNKLTIDEEQEDIEQDDILSRCSSSSDIPLKERRRRRSPLMFTHNDKLVLPLPKNDIYSSSSSSSSPPPLSSSALNREKTMQQLEGNKERKTIIIPRIASTKSLDKQMALNDHMLTHSPSSSPKYNSNQNNQNNTTLMNKAHYDAVVSRTSLNRRPSSTLSSISPSSPFPPPSTSTTIPLLTPNTGKTLNSLHLLSSSSTTTTSPPPPPPLSSSYNTTTSSKYLLPTPTTQQYQSSLYFPTTPNSMDLSY
ncbi:hypothetical protein BJ944DRAFT_79483 [Cunninghamella echinulata]|nr:hypothetical protein BJ944DRAFT_79483 [Cunninghamella echinulata]